MSLRVVCPGCSARLTVNDNLRGQTTTCRRCGDPVAVPASGGEVVADEPPPIPARPTTAPHARPARDDFDDDRPRRPRRRDPDDEYERPRKSNTPLILGVVAVVVVGIGVVAYGFASRSRQAERVAFEAEREAVFAHDVARDREREHAIVMESAVRNDRVTQANYNRLQTGMTYAEVTNILGPGEQVTPDQLPRLFAPAHRTTGFRHWSEPVGLDRVVTWRNAGDRILASFNPAPDATGRLQSRSFITASSISTSYMDDESFARQYLKPTGAKGKK